MPLSSGNTPVLPLVSILIRSIDRIPLLQEALASVARQSYPHIEIVVVAALAGHADLDDCCGPYPLRLVPTDRALHRCRAANVALDAARGDYLLFLDDDDWLLPDHIEKLAAALTDAPEVLAAYTGVQPSDPDGQPLGEALGQPFDELRLLAGNWMPPHAVLFRRRVMELGCRFDEGLDLFEDWDFWLQIAQHSRLIHVPGVSACYRIHASSGVHENAPFVGPAYARLYDKWRHRWSAEQIAGMMDRVWKAPDQQVLITELHRRIAEQQECIATQQGHISAQQAYISTQQAHIVAQQGHLSAQQGHNAELAQHISVLEQEIHQRNVLLEERLGLIEELLHSTSWRITRPLRSMRRALAGLPLVARAIRSPRRAWGFMSRTAMQAVRGDWQGVQQNIATRIDAQIEATTDYRAWIARFEPSPESYSRLSQISQGWQQTPTISVVMPTYNSDAKLLKAAIDSVVHQLYPHWQLCIADDASDSSEVRALLDRYTQQDARIQVIFRPVNGHISAASNSALALAKGEFVALLDHDDLLHPLALWFVAQASIENPGAGLIYSDEDKISPDGQRCDPYFKCDFNYELLLAQNMISHLGCYRRTLVDEIGGFRESFEGSQDYDLALRAIERLKPEQIVHIPRVLYHWRVVEGSTASSIEEKPYALTAAHRALSEHLQRRGLAAEVLPAPEIPHFTRVRFTVPRPAPLVSILIPTRDKADLLRQCIDSIFQLSTYSPYEIIVIDNGSTEDATLKLFDQLRQRGVRVLPDNSPFNFSVLNNRAAAEASGSLLCLMNNDIEIITPDWLEEMVSFASQKDIGVVGARLWYPNGRLQHGGVILGMGGVAGHSFLNLERGAVGYFGRAALHQSLSVVTAACMVVRKSVFDELGGFDERLAVAFNDVDFCLRVRQAGYRNVWTPYAEMVHHESASRGQETTPEKQARFASEVAFMDARWGSEYARDPAYSPNLTLAGSDFSLSWPPRIVQPF